MAKADLVCALCGAPVRPAFRPPAPEQAPDLDLRPGEPQRSTLRHWVQTCYCAASAPDLTLLPPAAKEVLQTADYAALRPSVPEAPFRRWSLIAHALGRQADAAEALLQAAWMLDDLGPPRELDAAGMRRQAVAIWPTPPSAEAALRLIDIQRRAGLFEAAGAAAQALAGQPLTEEAATLLAFQQSRIALRDAKRHGMGSVLRPPTRRPHVTRGQAPAPAVRSGFWSRLLGR